ncbi:MAG TPA: SsrA-binding protein SmpB [Anaeromyxobacteraceae bacterium]|nr:SsrA-binding protein SmpB [Anaeromyxobacteraceae bacterium]
MSARRAAARGPAEGVKVVATNRRARFDFEIEDVEEAGLALTGSEVKSLRAGNVNLSDAYAQPRGAEIFLVNCRIGEYREAGPFGHVPLRDRKLLLHRAQIDRLRGKIEQRGYTLVPLRVYFKEGWAKVELGLARGRARADRRDAIAERETRREIDRAMARRRRR